MSLWFHLRPTANGLQCTYLVICLHALNVPLSIPHVMFKSEEFIRAALIEHYYRGTLRIYSDI